ncbi:hypothetical protein FisN_11Hh254 [Fistulifera solaris]|jgi:hypothetical protein|uniref:Uncharacterized protein n=1 Tax=Fistulifera solaris TaxID=1519565 RepID=A0A1Z5JL17_FISSO|nr:hypothetical protein FisN_11Hh254 [Fistulifera solaris]|eukprot:GAX14713.1 hypothetical protein FisN_11Hh254 [Fistulifera solaris]
MYEEEESDSSLYAPEGKARIALFLVESQASFDNMISITAGLLTSGHQVTLFCQQSEHQILHYLLSRIPCADHWRARSLLTFQAFDEHPFPCNDAFPCEIQNAAGLVKELHSKLRSDPFDLVVTDGIFVAGMVVAELLTMPTIALLEGTNYHLRKIFGPIASNQPWYTWLVRVIYDRLQLLDQMKEFVELNRLRTQFGLKRLRTLTDFWTRENQILMTLQNVSIPKVLRIPSPLLPPCVPCLPNEFSNTATHGSPIALTDTPALIMAVTFPDTTQGRISFRTLMQALSLARASLQEIAQTSALKEDNAGRAKRWSGPSNFIVVRWGKSFEELQPAFVITESPEYVWDSLVRHKPVVGIVTNCDGGDFDYIQNMGFPILCLERHPQSPRELGKAILKFINVENDFTTSSFNPNDGLVWLVSLIDELTNREVHGTMEVLNERIHSLQTILFPELDSYQAYENSAITWLTLAVEYMAWTIMISVLLYVHLKPIFHKFYPFSKRHTRRSHRDMHEKPITLTLIAEEWVDRLPELDYVFDIWKIWLWQELANFQKPKPNESNSSRTTKNKRRTHHHKKKH